MTIMFLDYWDYRVIDIIYGKVAWYQIFSLSEIR